MAQKSDQQFTGKMLTLNKMTNIAFSILTHLHQCSISIHPENNGKSGCF